MSEPTTPGAGEALSREWAERFLAEWARPYFGDDAADAVACVQRAALAAVVPPTEPAPGCEEPPECTCAMSEATFRTCEAHGEDSFCPDCGEPWVDHPKPASTAPAAPAAVGGGLTPHERRILLGAYANAMPSTPWEDVFAAVERILAARERARDAAVEQVARVEAVADEVAEQARYYEERSMAQWARPLRDVESRVRAALKGKQA